MTIATVCVYLLMRVMIQLLYDLSLEAKLLLLEEMHLFFFLWVTYATWEGLVQPQPGLRKDLIVIPNLSFDVKFFLI